MAENLLKFILIILDGFGLREEKEDKIWGVIRREKEKWEDISKEC